MNARMKLQEGSSEREDAIYKRASKKAVSEDAKFKPIRIELTNTSIGSYNMCGHDGFELTITDRFEGGIMRETMEISIVDKFQWFTRHDDYEGLILTIPSTERNFAILAAHVEENKIFIHEEDVRAKVTKLAEELKARRTTPVAKEDVNDNYDIKADLEKNAKERVFANHAEAIEKMRASGVKRVDLTVEFKEWLRQELELVHN